MLSQTHLVVLRALIKSLFLRGFFSQLVDMTFKTQLIIIARKFCIRRNNNKVNSVETGRIVIADLLP